GNRSPSEGPLMDHIRDFVAREEPDATVVPVMLPGFTDSRWFREAFPSCTAYGFMPRREIGMFEAAALMHAVDERASVSDRLRGVTRLAEALAVVPMVKRALPEAQLPMQDVRTIAAMAGAAAAGQAIRMAGPRTVVRELGVGAVSMLPALFALRGGDLASYHGVEHKAIAGYEQDEDAAAARKEHERCGSNLVAPMLASAAVGNVAIRRAGLRGPAAEGAVALVSVAIAVEVFSWSERHPESRLARLLRRPGHEIQRTVGTREPTPEQLEVGRAALDEILRVERESRG